MKKTTMTKRTRDAKVKKFARDFNKAFDELQDFVSTNCKGNAKKRDKSLDAICEIVDKYLMLNGEVRDWCHDHKVDLEAFVCDVMNEGNAK